VPFFPRIRKALGVPESTNSTAYYEEQHDNTPVPLEALMPEWVPVNT